MLRIFERRATPRERCMEYYYSSSGKANTNAAETEPPNSISEKAQKPIGELIEAKTPTSKQLFGRKKSPKNA
jgi:hypothetical protein